MEYPNIVFVSDSLDSDDEMKKVIVHEIAHQWWRLFHQYFLIQLLNHLKGTLHNLLPLSLASALTMASCFPNGQSYGDMEIVSVKVNDKIF